MQPILTIAIPTVVGREEKFNRLVDFLMNQIAEDSLQEAIEVIYEKDNKEISIGAKRQKLYERANGIYTFMPDDDDWLAQTFCKTVADACMIGDDCIGYIENCNINGKDIGNSIFSKDYPDWVEKLTVPFLGCVRARTPFFKTPIKTEICRTVGVKDMRFGEDHDFSRRVLPHLKSQTLIPEVMYYYVHETEGTHNKRYGI